MSIEDNNYIKAYKYKPVGHTKIKLGSRQANYANIVKMFKFMSVIDYYMFGVNESLKLGSKIYPSKTSRMNLHESGPR